MTQRRMQKHRKRIVAALHRAAAHQELHEHKGLQMKHNHNVAFMTLMHIQVRTRTHTHTHTHTKRYTMCFEQEKSE